MSRISLALAIALAASPAHAQTGERVSDCIALDGDTMRCGDERIRIQGLDTPEIYTVEQCRTREDTVGVLGMGYAAQGRLQKYLNDRDIRVVRKGRDRYGRTVAQVLAGSDDVADLLIASPYSFARRYDCPNDRCPRRDPWCP